jgi:hypothetical protein
MILHTLLLLTAVTMSPYRPLPDDKPAAAETVQPQLTRANLSKAKQPCDTAQGVAKLPYAHGHRFCSLDEYLGHLERYAAPIDQPWWRQVRPGIYEHVKSMPGAKREVATRAELIKRFGFSK